MASATILAVAYLVAYRNPRDFRFGYACSILFLALLATAATEQAREMLRKPYVIGQHMFSNAIRQTPITIGEQPDTVKIAKAATEEQGDYAFAGAAVQDLDRETARELGIEGNVQGVVVTSVDPDSGAGKAGLIPGDVIREINRKPVKSVKDFERMSSVVKKGENVLILINRRGASLFLSAKV